MIPPMWISSPPWTLRRRRRSTRRPVRRCAPIRTKTADFAYWWVSTRYGVASADVEDFHYFPAPGGGPFVDHAEQWNMK